MITIFQDFLLPKLVNDHYVFIGESLKNVEESKKVNCNENCVLKEKETKEKHNEELNKVGRNKKIS